LSGRVGTFCEVLNRSQKSFHNRSPGLETNFGPQPFFSTGKAFDFRNGGENIPIKTVFHRASFRGKA
jgi:hypothetical protein